MPPLLLSLIFKHTHACTHTHARTHTYPPTHAPHTHTHAHTHTRAHTHTHTHTHTRAHTHTHTRTHTHAHTHTHTHTHTGNSEARSFLHQILLRAHTASGDRESHHVWQTCISDLQRVSELSPPLSAIAQCSATFLQCQLLMGKVGVAMDVMCLPMQVT